MTIFSIVVSFLCFKCGYHYGKASGIKETADFFLSEIELNEQYELYNELDKI